MSFAAAPLYGVSSAVLLSIVLAFARGGLNATIAGVSLAFGLLATGAALWSQRDERPAFRRPGLCGWLAITAFSLFSLRAFLWLVFRAGDEIRILSPNNLGDLSLHLTYIHYLANGVPFWPENPIISGAALTYPLGVDLFNALLVLVGFDTLRSLIWVGLASAALTGFALWRWGGAFTLFGFLANGGLAGFVALRTGELLDYQAELAWKSFALALFVTQRGLLFAIPAGLLLVCSWRLRFFQSEAQRKSKPLPLWGELLLYAALPVFHLHTFLFLSLLLLAWFVVHPPLRRPLIRFIAFAILPATALVLLVTANFSGPKLISWHPGWMQGEPEFLALCLEQFGTDSPWVVIPFFWLLNFGVLPFFVLAVLIRVALRRGEGNQQELAWARAVVIPSVAIFVLCCFVKFAPWAWDNTKVMIWSYLLILPFLWSELIVQWPKWLRFITCFGLFWSGFVSTFGGIDRSHRGFEIALRSELDFLRPALVGIPATERFIAHPTYNHPLLLIGRPLVLGYNGHVWSHGYSWEEQQARIESILNGAEDWKETAAATGARYLFWGLEEQAAYSESTQPWKAEARLVASGEWGELYDLREPAELPPEPPADPQE